jgi:hypothetical protein
MNLCRRCGLDFSSLEAFDAHRTGRHEYLWTPEREDGRRCLDTEELEALGWEQNDWGRWFDPMRSARHLGLGGRAGAPATAQQRVAASS